MMQAYICMVNAALNKDAASEAYLQPLQFLNHQAGWLAESAHWFPHAAPKSAGIRFATEVQIML